MSVNNFDIVSPVTDKNKPFYLEKRKSIVCRFKIIYKYYLEASRFNENTQDTDYYILLGKTKFDENCRQVNNDNFGRAIIRLHKGLLNYISTESNNRGNINIEYLESTNEYDIYSVE